MITGIESNAVPLGGNREPGPPDRDALWETGLYALHAQVEDRHWWFRARRRILVEVAHKALESRTDPLVVDVGCGTGGNLGALASHYRGVGIEPAQQAVELARKRFPEIQFLAGHAPEDLGSVAAEADLFLLTDVLEHVEKDVALLGKLLERAKPGAHFIITVPADMSLWSRHDVALGHFRRYDPERLAATWHGQPVNVRLLTHFNARLYLLVRAARLIGRFLNRSIGPGGTDQAIPPAPLNTVLESTFAGEAARIVAAIDQAHAPYHTGSSLLALVRRDR